MTYNEQDPETLILQKLEALEDLLKSFVAGLEEPLQKRGKRIYGVYAPATGRILEWYKGNDWVDKGDELCRFEYVGIPFIRDIESPARGYLRIESWIKVGETVVSMGETIATVDVGVPV